MITVPELAAAALGSYLTPDDRAPDRPQTLDSLEMLHVVQRPLRQALRLPLAPSMNGMTMMPTNGMKVSKAI